MEPIDKKLAQTNITAFVNAYKWGFPDEYGAVVRQVKENRSKNASRTGDIKATDNAIDTMDRPIHEISETLFSILHNRLSEPEMAWFGTIQGARWFAKTFPEFSRVEKV